MSWHVRLRTLGVAATLTVGVTAAATPAYAEPTPGGPEGKATQGVGPTLYDVAIPPHKLPAGAVRATQAPPRLGSYGAPFQKPVTTTRAADPRIVGGTLANAAEHPWIVGLQSFFLVEDENGEFEWWVTYCTGTVVTPTKVLTAAHCTVGLPFGETFVIAGRNDMDAATGGYIEKVSSTWTHQGFNAEALNTGEADVPVDDVAVLTLKGALPSAYTPVQLSAQGDQSPYADGTEALIVGYGVTSSDTFDPGILRKATVPFKSNATCAEEFAADYDPARMACAGIPATETTTGVDTCGGDSGGPILVNGVQVGITDWGPPAPCGTSYGVYERLSYYNSAIRADFNRPSLINLDWSGDGHSDLFTRTTDGWLIEHSGSGFANDGFGGFAGTGFWGEGWNGYTKLFRVTDWTADAPSSIMARDSAGRLFEYPNVAGGIGDARQVGSGWNSFSDIMVTNNWTGNGLPNLMGRTPTGDLYLYTSDGQGGWLNNGKGIKIGSGWNSFDTVLTPGTWAGNGRQALIGRTPAGALYLYESDGQGGWVNPRGTLIGSGWNGFRVFMSPGDWNGDNMIDLIGVTPAGGVFLYTTNGFGAWLNSRGQQIDSGWNIYNAVF